MFETVNDFQYSLNGLTKRNEVFFKAAFERQKQLTKPPGSLGKLEEYACFMAAWQNNERPEIKGRLKLLNIQIQKTKLNIQDWTKEKGLEELNKIFVFYNYSINTIKSILDDSVIN